MAAYNIFPKTSEDIVDLKLDGKKTAQLVSAFRYAREKVPNIETPFALSRDNNYRVVKVMRYVSSSLDIRELKRRAQFFTFTPGDGSRTKKGLGSKGTEFENDLYNSLVSYSEQGLDSVTDNNTKKFIKELVQQYSLNKQMLEISLEGKKNTRRGHTFSGNQVVIGSDLNNFDIGKTVTDITVRGKEDIYLSLKYDAFSFFNIGVTNIIPKEEIIAGHIHNPKGIQLLNLFGIDNTKFCEVFNHYKDNTFKKPRVVDTSPKYDETNLKKFIMSGIGYGYHMVHKKKTGGIEHYDVTRQIASSKSNIKSVTIEYPFVTGKVVYVNILTDIYLFKVMFRNNQSALYPNVCLGYAHPL